MATDKYKIPKTQLQWQAKLLYTKLFCIQKFIMWTIMCTEYFSIFKFPQFDQSGFYSGSPTPWQDSLRGEGGEPGSTSICKFLIMHDFDEYLCKWF